MSRPRLGCLKWLLLAALAAVLAAYVAGEWFFNLSSNLVALSVRDSKAPLLARTKRGEWKKVSDLTVAEVEAALVERHREEGLRWCSLTVRRAESSAVARLAQGLFGAEVNVLWISPAHHDFTTSFQPKFAPTTAAERMEAENLWFAITANFRDPAGKPLGWVYHEGRQVNPPFPTWTGVFFVKGGQPFFGPKSLLDEVAGPVEEGTQGYPSVMKNHTVFPYVDLAPNKFFDGKKVTYRSLAGMKRDGTIVFVLSGDGGVMNVSEVTEIAHKLEAQHATLLDGGRALQYSVRTDGGPWHFQAFNTTLRLEHRWLQAQRSPVFIAVRRKAPEIIVQDGR